MLPRKITAFVVVVMALVAVPGPTQAGDLSARPRIALVVGNGAYQYLPRLTNPANDARLMATTLQSVGFQLIGGRAQVDLDRAGFERAIRDFGTALANASVGLLYYAGHGLQLQGVNYLVPVTANPETAADVDLQLINASTVLKEMQSPGSALNIVILDACRNNPFAGRGLRDAGNGLAEMPAPRGNSRVGGRSLGDVGGGLAEMPAPRGTFISYATQPGNVAMDGNIGHSPYAVALAEAIKKPGIPILEVFNQIGLTVAKATSGRQQPWMASSPLEGTFYFLGPTTVNITPASPDRETVFWQSIAQSSNAAEFQEYLQQFPQGQFAGLAHARIAALRAPPAVPGNPTIQPAAIPRPPPRVPVFTAGLAERITEVAKAQGIGVPPGFDFREPGPDIPAAAVAYLGAWGPGTDTNGCRKIRVIKRIENGGTVHVIRMWSDCLNGRWQAGSTEVVGQFVDGKIQIRVDEWEELELLDDGRIQQTKINSRGHVYPVVLPRLQ
jgi:hypothetical protein